MLISNLKNLASEPNNNTNLAKIGSMSINTFKIMDKLISLKKLRCLILQKYSNVCQNLNHYGLNFKVKYLHFYLSWQFQIFLKNILYMFLANLLVMDIKEYNQELH